MTDQNICSKCINNSAPPSQSSCWACKDNDLFKPFEEVTPEEQKDAQILIFREVFGDIKNRLEKVLQILGQRESEKTAAKVVELEKKLEETTEMLNYAISDLRSFNNCGMCKHFKKEKPYMCLTEACKENDCWEWRGKSGRE